MKGYYKIIMYYHSLTFRINSKVLLHIEMEIHFKMMFYKQFFFKDQGTGRVS